MYVGLFSIERALFILFRYAEACFSMLSRTAVLGFGTNLSNTFSAFTFNGRHINMFTSDVQKRFRFESV